MEQEEQRIIEQLVETLPVRAIYVIPFLKEPEKQLFLILCSEGTIPKGPSGLSAQFFQSHPQYVYRIYKERYALEQWNEGNIFFLQALSPKYLEYGSIPVFTISFEQALKRAQSTFAKECAKVLSFREGATFYLQKENYSLAAFMLHQAIELSFRVVELITIGKEKICHKIMDHQKYVQYFMPELGYLFSEVKDKERQLLILLDMAYQGVRYGRDYKIDHDAFELLQVKLARILEIAQQEFNCRYEYCKDVLPPVYSAEPEIRDKIEQIMNRKLRPLGTHPQKWYYKAEFRVNGVADILYDVAGMLKVCIAALDYGDSMEHKLIPQPQVNVQTTLEHILQLLPLEEIEMLEEIINSYNQEGNEDKLAEPVEVYEVSLAGYCEN